MANNFNKILNDVPDISGNSSNVDLFSGDNYSGLGDNSNGLGNNLYQGIQNQGNKVKKIAIKSGKAFSGLSTLVKILVIFLIIFLIILVGYIFWYKENLSQIRQFENQPLFMTGIQKREPHDAKNIFCYLDKYSKKIPYIPASLIEEKNVNQYSYSYWIYVDGKNWNYKFGDWKHIFHRGSKVKGNCEDTNSTKNDIINIKYQCPGFWISPKQNTLVCIINTDNEEERIELEDIELNKWFNITVVFYNRSVSLYKNGMLEKVITLYSTLSVNKNNLYINYFGGFSGNMALLQYFNTSLNSKQIQDNYKKYHKIIEDYIKGIIIQPSKDKCP